MKLLKTTLLFVFLQLLLGCSWVQRFMIVNETDETIEINYSIKTPTETFAIFESQPDAYSLKRKGQINWEKKLQLEDLDTNFFEIKIKLPPKTVLIIGALYNNEYTSYDQHFINGRSFNLTQINIIHNSETNTITAETFDNYFTKRNGSVTYVLK